jgi:hypothetical protein
VIGEVERLGHSLVFGLTYLLAVSLTALVAIDLEDSPLAEASSPASCGCPESFGELEHEDGVRLVEFPEIYWPLTHVYATHPGLDYANEFLQVRPFSNGVVQIRPACPHNLQLDISAVG